MQNKSDASTIPYLRSKRGTSTAYKKHPQPEAKARRVQRKFQFLKITPHASRGFFESFHKSARHTKGISVGPDRLRRIPSAEKFKKIGQHLMLATVVLASSASSPDAQSTPKFEPLSNHHSTKHLELPSPVIETEVNTSNQNTVKLSELENQQYEFNLSEILDKGKREISSDNKNAKSLSNDDNLSPITGYYCRYIPGYIIGDWGGYCGLTKMGIPVEPGIAACGIEYPLGSYIEVEGFGRLFCADRGGELSPSQVDIFFETNEQLEKSNKPDFAKVKIVDNP